MPTFLRSAGVPLLRFRALPCILRTMQTCMQNNPNVLRVTMLLSIVFMGTKFNRKKYLFLSVSVALA